MMRNQKHANKRARCRAVAAAIAMAALLAGPFDATQAAPANWYLLAGHGSMGCVPFSMMFGQQEKATTPQDLEAHLKAQGAKIELMPFEQFWSTYASHADSARVADMRAVFSGQNVYVLVSLLQPPVKGSLPMATFFVSDEFCRHLGAQIEK